MRVYLDPGHGGSNPGCSYGALSEKAYVLDLATRAGLDLRRTGHQAETSRAADVTTSFIARAEKAKAWGADFALVLHVNANPDPKCAGLRTYVMPEAPALDAASLRLAQLVMTNAPAPLRHPGRAPEIASLDGQGDDVVLRHYDCPAVLIEVGFASNPSDLSYLLSVEGKCALSAMIGRIADAWKVVQYGY
jgi:N-acetylmuramoyl-L-alanine amidase